MVEVSRESGPDQFLGYVTSELLTREGLEEYIRGKQATYSFEEILGFWSKVVAEKIPKQWDYQRSPVWDESGRSPRTAVRETVLQTLSHLCVDADFVTYKGNDSSLPGVTKEQAREIHDKALFLIEYFSDLFSPQKTPQPVQC